METSTEFNAEQDQAPGRAPSLQKKRRRVVLAVAMIAACAILLAGLDVVLRKPALQTPKPPAIQSIAVLPLQDLSGDPNEEYYADGMTDELITDLAGISGLQVISRTSMMQYKGTRKSLPQIGRELGVDAIVEGSVSHSADRVRIRVQLVQARPNRHLWAGSYEESARNVLRMKDDVARAIADQIRVRLTPQDQARLTGARRIDPESYEMYLKGRYFFSKRTQEGARKSVECFQRAIEIFPGHAAAYARLSDALASLSYLQAAAPADVMPRAKAAAEKALEMDAGLGEAHASLAMIQLTYDWDWAGAEREFQRALELNPNCLEARQFYTAYLEAMGRLNEAIAESRWAQRLDPLSVYIGRDLGRAYYYARQYDRAIRQFRATIEMDPSFPLLRDWLAAAYEKKGMERESIGIFLEQHRLKGTSAGTLNSLRRAYELEGPRGYWGKSVELLKKQAQQANSVAYDVATAFARLGDRDQAMAWLEKAYNERSLWMIWLKVDPALDPLRSDPRFQALQRRVGLPL